MTAPARPSAPPRGLRIRPAEAADAPALAALLNLIEAPEADAPGMDEAAVRADILSGRQNVEALAAEAEGAVIGVLLHQRSYETSHRARGRYVLDLAVAEAMQGRGVGRALLAASAAITESEGGAYVWWLRPGRIAEAPGLYRRLADVQHELAAFAVTETAFAALAEEGRASG